MLEKQKDFFSYLVSLSPILFVSLWALLAFGFPDKFLNPSFAFSETSLVEISGCIFVFIASLALFYAAFSIQKKLPNTRYKLILLFWFIGLGLVSLFLAGEEASWGQHLFHWKTPETLVSENAQGETNFHNGFGLIGFLARTLPLLGLVSFIAGISVIIPIFKFLFKENFKNLFAFEIFKFIEGESKFYTVAGICGLVLYFIRKIMKRAGIFYPAPEFFAVTEFMECMMEYFLLLYGVAVIVRIKR